MPVNTLNFQDFNKIELEKYKQDLLAFKAVFDSYEERRREINKNFEDAMQNAMREFKATKSPTQMQKRINAASKQKFIMKATALRDAAMQSLGLPPVAPTPPPRPEGSDKSRR